MGSNQGVILLKRGSIRELTPSEISRGYIFITKDKLARVMLGETFTCSIQGKAFNEKSIDSFGRIYAGKSITRSLEGKSWRLASGRKEE